MNSIEELVAQLGSEDQTKAYQAQMALQAMVSKATRPGESEERSRVATALAEELTAKVTKKGQGGRDEERPKHSAAVRNQLAQFLSEVGDDNQVPALAFSLMDLSTREMARWALDRIETPAATKALISAVQQVGPEFRVGVINSLARRVEPEVQAALLLAASDDDTAVRLAAVEALASFPEPSNDEPIVAATKLSSPRARRRAQRSRVRLAESLRRAGKKDAAIAIYKAIAANDADEPQKKAARLALEQLT